MGNCCQNQNVRQPIENIAYNELEKIYEFKRVIKFRQYKQTYLVSEKTHEFVMQVIPKRQDDQLRQIMSVKHKNIMSISQIFQTEQKSIIIYQYDMLNFRKADAKQLFLYLKEYENLLDIALIKQIFTQLVNTLKFLNDRKIQHQTLCPQKILIKSDGQLILLGLLDLKRDTEISNPLFEPPEGFANISEKTNVWICGLILLILLKGTLPNKFSYLYPQTVKTSKKLFDAEDQSLPTQARRLLVEMLKENPEERASINAVANHQWIISDSNKVTPRQVMSSEKMIKFEQNLVESIYIEYCVKEFIQAYTVIMPFKDKILKHLMIKVQKKSLNFQEFDQLKRFTKNEAVLLSIQRHSNSKQSFEYEDCINKWEQEIVNQCKSKLEFCFKNGQVKKKQVSEILQPSKLVEMNSLIFKVQDQKFEIVNDEYTISEFMDLIKIAVVKITKDILNNQQLTFMIDQELQNEFEELKQFMKSDKQATITKIEQILLKDTKTSNKEAAELLQQLLKNETSKECKALLKVMINKLQL